MLKKRAMDRDKWGDGDWAITDKSLQTGYADDQPKWPYWVQPLNYSAREWNEIGYWIVDTMGYSDWSVEHARWVGTDRKYWFRDERDRTMFILKWSS